MIDKEFKADEKDPWDQIMAIARREGFVVQAVGGVATLATHEAQKSAGIFEKTQRMNGKADKTLFGYSGKM